MRTILVSAALVLLASSFAGAQVTCGHTIGNGQTVTLTDDITCDSPAAAEEIGIGIALTVDGGTLDLGGHTVTCADTDGDGRIPFGIVLKGTNSTLVNGTVSGCNECLQLGFLDV